MEIKFTKSHRNPEDSGFSNIVWSPDCPNGKTVTIRSIRTASQDGKPVAIPIVNNIPVAVGSEHCIACSYCGGYDIKKGEYYMNCRFKKGDLFYD